MIELPDSIMNSVKSFSKLPGVGEKTALRQVMNMVKWDQEDLMQFSNAITELILIKRCTECGLYSQEELCDICLDQTRQANSYMCVVENINDLIAIEKSNDFRGVYHVLGGVLNPLLGIGPEQLKINKLVERVHALGVETLVLAINPSVEGDATCSYIKQLLMGLFLQAFGQELLTNQITIACHELE